MNVTIAGTGNMARADCARSTPGPYGARELEAVSYLHMAIQHIRDTLLAPAVKVLP